MPGGMGASPITHQEIAAWCALTGITLGPWESRTLRRLSRDYVGELHEAADPKRKPPWQPDDYEPDYAGTVKAMRNAFAEMDRL